MSGSSPLLASPTCTVDIYPWEGGLYSIQGGQLLACEISKDIRSGDGSAVLVLAPGGPNGVQTAPSWSEVLSLRSLVVIAMSRAGHSNVVFVGVVEGVREEQGWFPAQRVVRTIQVTARDWMAWFRDFQWSALSVLALTNGLAIAYVTDLPTDSGLAATTLSAGENAGNPSQVGWDWFHTIMGGAGGGEGILDQTSFPYQGQPLQWSQATTAWFESYPIASFPNSFYYISRAGNWLGKFREIFDDPWYELLIGTVPVSGGIWFTAPQASGGGGVPFGPIGGLATVTNGQLVGASPQTGGPTSWYWPGQAFTSVSTPGAAPAVACIVARINPHPDLVLQTGGGPQTGGLATQASSGLAGQQAYSYSQQATSTRWEALPLFQPDLGTASFINASTRLFLTGYANFFFVNPRWLASEVAGANPAGGPYPILYSGAANPAGIHRFGLHSYVKDTYWWADLALLAQQSDAVQTGTYNSLYAGLTTRCASLMTPLPIMRAGDCLQPLRPDIFPGCRWRMTPFPNEGTWDFYIQGVNHSWKFGGPSTTKVTLDRGLPTAVYENTTQLALALTGNLQFQNGVPVAAPASAGPGLQTFSSAPAELRQLLGEIAGIFSNPQQS